MYLRPGGGLAGAPLSAGGAGAPPGSAGGARALPASGALQAGGGICPSGAWGWGRGDSGAFRGEGDLLREPWPTLPPYVRNFETSQPEEVRVSTYVRMAHGSWVIGRAYVRTFGDNVRPPLRCGRRQSWSCHGVLGPQHLQGRQAGRSLYINAQKK